MGQGPTRLGERPKRIMKWLGVRVGSPVGLGQEELLRG